ncbi:DNA helicase [Salmonella phage vB_SnwM_CGG4-1]|uniref:UvsW.1 domain-containing protein n=1 Tax=Salmonella phage vB_SnwM_CGG4-1 TaxID=1815631 RepID=A0A1B0VVH5_9CAUD|nr:DNA helicase [Salmonella phage vB_SnwM_CGG4-1]ANA49528.1 hypothetical protein CGG41_173 [Salmonella phage vB_SnwM_CGG4-1]
MEFKQFIREANIGSFMNKIAQCQTLDGLDELEAYYKKRIKTTEINDTDDISIRDALAGKRMDFESDDESEVEEDF